MAPRKYDSHREKKGAIRKLPSGRLQASYLGPDGRRHNAPETFDNLTDARDWISRRVAEIARGDWKSPEQVAQEAQDAAKRHARRSRTLRDYASEWITTRTNRRGVPLRARTVVEYQGYLRRSLEPLVDRMLTDIHPEDVRAWRDTFAKQGKLTMAARVYGFLNSVMETAVRDRLIDENPCQVEGGGSSSTGRKSTIPTGAEFAIMEANMPERFLAMIAVAGWAGLRFGEVTELRRGDIVEDEDGTVLVTVSRGVTHPAGMGFIVGPPKSAAGVRTRPLHPSIGARLLKHLAEHVGPENDALLFPSKNGKHLAYSTFTKSWYPARAAAGREDMTWHTLRSYAATRYAEAGATQKEIQEFLGDSTMTASALYQHSTGRERELAARMA